MSKKFSKKFYASKQWKDCRESYIVSIDKLCEICLIDGKLKPGKELHHIIEITPNNINDVNITLNWSNLIYLCHKCHDKFHNRYQKSDVISNELTFDSNGQLIKLYDNN
jgi:5-methylcytosine-specific restriction endonuclease McrA